MPPVIDGDRLCPARLTDTTRTGPDRPVDTHHHAGKGRHPTRGEGGIEGGLQRRRPGQGGPAGKQPQRCSPGHHLSA